MATLNTLLNAKTLLLWDGYLKPGEAQVRYAYLTPELMDWIENDLTEATGRHPIFSPDEQVTTILDEYTRGDTMARGDTRKLERPPALGNHIWELKTDDVRIFGYFYRPKHFIGVCAELKVNLKKVKLYTPYVNKVLKFRKNCDLVAPTHQTQDNVDDLL